MVIGELALFLVYFGVVLPVGLVARIARRDALKMKFDREATSYWEAKSKPRDTASYYRQS